MAELELKIDSAGLEKAAELFPQRLAIRMRQAFRQIGHDFCAIMKRERLSGRPGLIHRSGDLSRSLIPITTTGATLDDLLLTIKIGGDTAPYAKTHEEGKTIKAKPGKALAIPLAAAKTASGRPRFTSPTEVPDLVMIKRPGRAPLLVKQHISGRGKSRTVGGIPMYVLVRSVKIPARLGLYDTWRKERPMVVNVINQAIGETLEMAS